jgi:glutathione peroxidase
MRRRSLLLAFLAAPLAGAAFAGSPWVFNAIDGGRLDLADYRGGPVLVVNTASRCFYTSQYDGLQALWDTYRERGLTVVGIPSDSFKQELASNEEVKDFCEANFSIDFPMSTVVEVTGPDAHPFYAWAREQGYAPRWNFYKLLLDGEGNIVESFGTFTNPDAPKVTEAIEARLPRS